MKIEREHGGLPFWVVTIEPNELSFWSRGQMRPWPHWGRIGTINERGTIRVARPAISVPRGWSELVKFKLEDARDQLRSRGVLFDKKWKKNIADRKEERKVGTHVVRTTNPKYPENRFYGGQDPMRWAERVLTLSPNGTVAGFFHSRGAYEKAPYGLLYKDEYGHIKHGRLDMWPGSSSSPRASRRRQGVLKTITTVARSFGRQLVKGKGR